MVSKTLPSPGKLRSLCRTIATLDAILWPDEAGRSHFWTARWGREASVFEARDGQGDHLHVWLSNKGGGVIRGFAHESPMSPWAKGRDGKVWPGMWDDLPRKFQPAKKEFGFGGDEVTFARWWDPDADGEWVRGVKQLPRGRDPDGSLALLSILDGKPATYARWASDVLGRAIPEGVVKSVYAGKPIDEAMLAALDPDADKGRVADALAELGWPARLGNSKNVGRRAPSVFDAQYLVARDGNRTLLVIGGKIQAEGPDDRYGEILAFARKRLAAR